jgi:hypothetical protein
LQILIELCRGRWRFDIQVVHNASPDKGVDAGSNAMMHQSVPLPNENFANISAALKPDSSLIFP